MLGIANISLIFLLSEPGHEKPGLLSVNPGLIIWTIIIFVIVLIVLKMIAWGPLLKALNGREETIRTALENAEAQNKEAKILIEQNKKNLSEANAQAMKIINEGKEVANKIKDDIVNKANETTKKMIEQAKKEIEIQKETALEKIKDEISEVAIKTAEMLIKTNLDSEKQKKLIDDFITRIPKN
jgi:F-type H+-transporting ATPase subunit b